MLLGVAPVWVALIGGDVRVTTPSVGAYTDTHSVSNETVKVFALTTYTETHAVSAEGGTTGPVAEATNGLITLLADLELRVRIRYNKEKGRHLSQYVGHD